MGKKFMLRRGTVVMSLMDARHYIVIDNTGAPDKIVLRNTEDPEDEKTYAEGQIRTFFVYEKDTEEFPAPQEGEYLLEGGVFTRNGQEIETGTLKPVKILGIIPKGVILTVQSLKRDALDLFLYEVESERFEKLEREQQLYELVFTNRNIWMVKSLREDEVEAVLEEDKGPEKVKVLYERLTIYGGADVLERFSTTDRGFLLGQEAHREVVLKNYEDGEQEGRLFSTKVRLLFASDKAVKPLEDCDGDPIGLVYDDEHTGKKTQLTRVDFCLGADDREFSADVVVFDGAVRKITPTFIDKEGNFLVTTDEGIINTNFGHHYVMAKGAKVLEAVEKHPRLIGMEYGTAVNEFILGNEKLEAVRIRVEKTRDRGYVTTVTAEN